MHDKTIQSSKGPTKRAPGIDSGTWYAAMANPKAPGSAQVFDKCNAYRDMLAARRKASRKARTHVGPFPGGKPAFILAAARKGKVVT